MKTESEIKREIEYLENQLSVIEYLDKVIKEVCKDHSADILNQAEMIGKDLFFTLPLANRKWSNEVLKVAIRITEDGKGYVYGSKGGNGNQIHICGFTA